VLAAPFVAASQALPIVAVAPLIILLLGSGLWPHVVVSAVVVVFPLLITAVAGLRGVERDYHDVARVFGASRLQTIWYVELPLAARTLLSGVKLGLTLAVMGAVVSEYVNASSGLGFMINGAIGNFESATRYVALIALAALSIVLFSFVTLLERIILRW
jgi:NitT/TauT family transport system permease protein